jgi:hypothetical protein
MQLKNIELNGITESDINCLEISFARCKVSDIPENLEIGDKVINDVYPINIDADLPILQLNFESYIGYSITNESFTSWDDYQIFEGNAFRIYTKSRYLDFIQTYTFAHQVCGEISLITHYGIVCLNHIIDIVTTATPVVIEMNEQ